MFSLSSVFLLHKNSWVGMIIIEKLTRVFGAKCNTDNCTYVLDGKLVSCWNSHVEIPASGVMLLGDGILRGWWVHDSEALMNGISALIIETPECFLPPFCHIRTHWEQSQNQEVGSHQTESARELVLDFPVSRTVRDKHLFLSYLVYDRYFYYSSPKGDYLYLYLYVSSLWFWDMG